MIKKLTITSALAVALLATTACGGTPVRESDSWNTDRDTAYCTDKQGRRVSDDKCRRGGSSNSGMFMFMYLSAGQRVPAYGTRNPNAYRAPIAGKRYTPSATAARSISRGGFGSSARSSSSSSYGG